MRRCLTCGTRTTGSRCRACTRPKGRGSTRAWRKLRELVLARDGYRCTYRDANGRCETTRPLHVDHIVPVAHGGTDDPTNLRTLCREHNLHRGTRDTSPPTCAACHAQPVRLAGTRCPTCRANPASPDL